ncbi:hypothetical protein RR48_02669 [Papilio machaon]|uniref:Uncharacterized protein n=1 Tax=Papilio machaon TaxID=76193 RepID=A0A0N1PHZ8_PAPMA|nr:hypothetical protein RR48_02669 [Papilio machaon]
MATVMENMKKERAIMRRLHTKIANEIESTLEKEIRICPELTAAWSNLDEINIKLSELNDKIKSTMLDEDIREEELEKEILDVQKYTSNGV